MSSSVNPPSPSLVLDASSSVVFVGVLANGSWLACQTVEEEALDAVFTGANAVLSEADLEIKDIRSYILCEGPGSVLGIRIASMAIRSWQSLFPEGLKNFAFQGLRFAVACVRAEGGVDGYVAAPSRMGRWNVLAVNASMEDKVEELEEEALSELTGAMYLLDQRGNGRMPLEHSTVDYDLRGRPELMLPLLREVAQPDAWVPERPQYKKWEKKRHS